MTSDRLFELLLAQTWQLGVLAAAVWGIVRICGRDRPHLAHCLWALVLLKCLVPPVWTSPVGLFCWINAQAKQLSTEQWFMQSTVAPQQSTAEPVTTIDVAIRIFDATSLHESSPAHTGSSTSRTLRHSPAIEHGEKWLLTLWLLGCSVSFFVAIARLGCFGRIVRRSSSERKQAGCHAHIEDLVQQLCQQLQVGRRVQIAILDAAVGPAVFGLVRPTILLPAAIVHNRTLPELEPLVAHELIHIRRGDLWWALVQALACCLFWFHPLVWLAQVMMVREAERSCDEETIASLGISSSTYARSLLDVLECKQRLRGAPALPGVRSVDVTRSRLERIMRLGHGSHARSPVWIWLLFFSCVAVILPGGVWLNAQDGKATGTIQTVLPEELGSTKSLFVPPAAGAWAESWRSEAIDVGDLLDQLEAQHGDRDVARGMLLTMIPQRSIDAINAEGKATISAVPEFSIDGDDLHVFETPEQMAIIKNGLEELRRFGFDSVRLRLKLLTVSSEQLEALELKWEKASEPASEVMARLEAMRKQQEMSAGQLPAAPAAFHPVQPASAAGETPQPAPTTIVERIESEMTVEEFEAPVREQLEGNQPLAGYVRSDLGIESQLVIRGLSSPVTTYSAVVDTEIVADISKLIENGENDAVLITPQITCGNGAYFQVSSYSPWSVKPQVVSFDRPAQHLPLPELGFSGFSLAARPLIEKNSDSDGKDTIDLSLVCETREVTRLDKFTFEAELADGEQPATFIEQPNVELKKLVVRQQLQAGDSLLISTRETLAPQSENKIWVIVATCEVVPAGATQNAGGQISNSSLRRPGPNTEPLPILGSMTSGVEVKKLPAPSAAEILAAWRNAKLDGPSLAGLDESRIRIVDNCIADFSDEQKFVPLIGQAILHHRLYKCSVYVVDESDKTETRATWLGSLVIDHHHFHVVDEQ